MCTVCGARMPAGGATSPRKTTLIDARFRGDAGSSSSTAVLLALSAALPDARPHRRIGPTTSLAGHQLLPSRATSAPRCGGYAGAGPSTPGDLVSGTHDNSPATPLGIDEVAPWVL
jgi:hypothetical protein